MTEKVNTKKQPSLALSAEEAMAAAVASRITSLRKAQNLTFDGLAKRSGVSKGTLVQIEQEKANPSISTLCRLASALGVSVADLVTPVEEGSTSVTLVPAAHAKILWHGSNGGYAKLLAGTAGADMLELWEWVLKPGERFEASRHSRGTREIIHVISGKLVLEVDERETLIAAGTTAIAHTDRPHAYANPGKSAVTFFMTVEEPGSAP